MNDNMLKKLFQQYSKGLLSPDEYRNLRTQIIDEITGEITVRRFDRTQPFKPSPQTTHVVNDIPAEPSPGPRIPVSLIASLAGIVFIVFALGTILYDISGGPEPEPPEKVTPKQKTQLMSESSEENPARQLVLNFLQQDQWQVADIESFVAHWESLPGATRDGANSTPWLREFTDKIAIRIAEQHQLVQSGDKNAASIETQLKQLAATVTSGSH